MSATRTYGAVEPLDGLDGWRITDIEPHVALRLKAVFPRIPRTGRLPFIIAGGPNVDADLDWFMQRYPLEIAPEHRDRMKARRALFEESQNDLLSILSKDWTPSGRIAFREGESPYTFQAQAAELARRTGRLLLMDDLGLGKTVSGLAAIVSPDALPAVIVVQTHLPGQWVEKIEEFTHLTHHVVKKASPYELPTADVYVWPYSRLAGWTDYFSKAPFASVIFDEAQELRNGTGTDKGRAAQVLVKGTGLRMMLTATPIYNYGFEIFNIVEFLEPGVLGSWNDFVTEWCTAGPGGKWIVKDPRALGTFLRETHLALRRTKADVGQEMPEPNVLITHVPYDEEAIADVDGVARDLATKVVSGTFTERGRAAREFDTLMRHATGVAKARHVAAMVKVLLEGGERVVLFGWHRDVYDIWLRELAAFRPVLYTGTESPKQKDAAKKAFIDGEAQVMILSLRSGAGLDGLQHVCSTVVFGELDWSPQVHQQCVGRIQRPGQKRQVDVIYLHTDGGSDPTVVKVLGLKADQSAGIVDPLSTPADQKMDQTRIRELAEQFLAKKQARGDSVPAPIEPQGSAQMELLG